VVSRNELNQVLYRTEYNGIDRSIDVYISRIRHKLGDDPGEPVYLKTVRGVGYLFTGPDDARL
jgi:DNA-binding response OmpR family regulator